MQEDIEKLNKENVNEYDLFHLDIVKNRKTEYPPMEDFLDAWVKEDEVALEEYSQKCLAVKAKYPKPL